MIMSYGEAMKAEAILEKNVRYDRGGKPLEVVIPYSDFVDFIEEHGLDLTDEEKKSIRDAEGDRKAGRNENFVSSGEAKRQLGI